MAKGEKNAVQPGEKAKKQLYPTPSRMRYF